MSLATFGSRLADRLEGIAASIWTNPLDLAEVLLPSSAAVPFVRTPALEVIADALIDVEEGRCDRLIICMPPQEGKSTLVTTIALLWFLIRNPNRRIGVVSYAQSLADKFSRDIRDYIDRNAGQDGTLDLGLRIAPDNGAVRSWAIDHRIGGVKAVGLRGGLTGHPLDALFIDDPIASPEQAQSSTFRELAVNFWQAVGSTRLAPGAPVVVVLTRWHELDLAGYLLSAPDAARWRVVSIPAIAEAEDDPLGREIGEPMISARGERDWEAIHLERGDYVWAALYQQRPAPAEGGLFKRTAIKHWTPCEAPSLQRPAILIDGVEVYLETLWKFLTVDLAASMKTGADFTVAALWGQTMDGQLVLLDGLRERLDPSMHWDAIKQLRSKWDAGAVYLEPASFGTTMVYEASQDGVPILELKPDKDKFTRAIPAAARADASRLWFPSLTQYAWVQDWIDELASFPNGAHDDVVDVTAYAANVAAEHWIPAMDEAKLRPPVGAEKYVDLMAAKW